MVVRGMVHWEGERVSLTVPPASCCSLVLRLRDEDCSLQLVRGLSSSAASSPPAGRGARTAFSCEL